MSFNYRSTYVKEKAIDELPEGFVILTSLDSQGRTVYHSLRADHTAKDRVIRGLGTLEDKIKVLRTMSTQSAEDCGLGRYLTDGVFTPKTERYMREFDAHPIDAIHIRRGTRYIYETAREALGVRNLYEGTETDLATYRAVLEVIAASGKIEHLHDPHAVHMTPELLELVVSDASKADIICRYIQERQVIARDIDVPHLKQYLADIHQSVGSGFL